MSELASKTIPVPGVGAETDRSVFYALALGTFAVGTEGFMIAAILPTIAWDLRVSIEATGLLVTVFSIVYALSSPVLTILTGAFSRRRLLLISLSAFAAANVVAAFAPNYWSLAVARVLLALAAGLYVPNANAFAGMLATPSYRGRALAIVNGGITVAIAVGVPLGGVVGAHFGWRTTFLGVAALAAAALATLSLKLPRIADKIAVPGLKERAAAVRAPGVLRALLTTTFWAMSCYTIYTYMAPFVSAASGISEAQAGWVLALLGCAALFGVTLGGHANDRFGSRRVQAFVLPLSGLVFAAFSVVALVPGAFSLPALCALVVLWGLSGWSFYPPQQARLIEMAGLHHTSVVLSLNSSFMYLGFALGAALGSLVIAMTSIIWVGLAAGLCTLIAVLIWK